MDIGHAERLVAGGRGLGSREGFDLLRRFADRIGAGVAASRMAVDLGWIDLGLLILNKFNQSPGPARAEIDHSGLSELEF